MDDKAGPPWGLLKRIAFRFACIYLVLYNLPLSPLWNALVPWFARTFLSIEIQVFPNGSGDTTFNYVQLLLLAATATATTILWSVLDRKRPSYERLHDGTRVLVRYVLAFTMIFYGISKVGQFPSPTLDVLQETYGESSPMRLMWTFMGASKPYCFFAGTGEVVGGLLLLRRRTTTLGALICAGVLANIVALDFCYDVPAKLFASHLLLMAVFLALPDARRLLDVLVFNRPTEARQIDWVPRSRGARVAKAALKAVILVFMLGLPAVQNWEMEQTDGSAAPRLYGIYDVESFSRRGEVAAVGSGKGAWRSLALDHHEMATLRLGDGTKLYFRGQEPADGRLDLRTSWTQDAAPDGAFTYERPDGDRLVLDGQFMGSQVSVRLRRVDSSKFLLLSRGFHWISEWPFNR
jgi:hypothetical protein